jgi:hypothetical protein
MIKSILLPIMSILTLVYSRKIVYTKEEEVIQHISYTRIPPKSYICICSPSYLVSEFENITDWSGECSNIQVCHWNKNEAVIKSWYHP